MSKITRKKSPKSAAGTPVRAKPSSKSKKPASKPAKSVSAKTSKATAKKSAKGAGKKPGNAPGKASQKAPSKPLKTSGRSESVAPVVAAAKPPAAKPPAANPPVANPPVPQRVVAKSSADQPPAPEAGPAAPRRLGLSEGVRAPAFRLPRDGGDTVSLDDFKDMKLVLFFYPRADTPGCTKEAIDFSRLSGAFAESQTAVLGVSADPLKAQEAFRDKHELVTPLVSDEQHEMLVAYGVWGEKSMYGKTFQGIIRTTVLLGGDEVVIKIWRNVKVDGHADEVLAAVRAL